VLKSRAPGRLGDQNVAGLGKARREVGEASGQGFGQRCRFVDQPLRSVKLRHGVHQHHRRPSGAKLLRQRLAPRDQFVGGDRSKFPAENPVLQVDQHERGRLWVECDHRRGSNKAEGRGLREMDL